MGREKDGSLKNGTDVVEERERIRRYSPGNSGGGGGKGSGEEDVKRRKSRRSTRDDDYSSGSGSESDTGSESEEETRRRSRKTKEKRKSYGKARRRRGREYDDDDSSSGSGSDSESEYSSDYSDSDESESEEERRRRKRKRREKEEREKKRMKREKEKKRRRKEKDEERDRKRKKKKEKEKRKKLEKGKKGAVTNSWGKYGIIRETDMWNKRPEFTAWLAEIKQVNLESLPPWEEKKMFKEFMEDHNTATFPSKKYYNIDAYERRKMEKEMKKGFKKVVQSERVVFNDEEQRRLELQQAREKQKEEEVIALKQAMEGGMAQAMREQARLKEEMTYLYKIGNIEAAAAIQKRLDPDVPM